MKSQNRITFHGKKRTRERTNTNLNYNALARIVSRNGLSKNDFKGAFYQYILSKSKSGARVKIYNDNIYIFSKNTKRLITTYKIPEKYLPIEQWKLDDKTINFINHLKYYYNVPILITFKDKKIKKGIISKNEKNKIKSFILFSENNKANNELIDLEKVDSIELDTEAINKELIDYIKI